MSFVLTSNIIFAAINTKFFVMLIMGYDHKVVPFSDYIS